MIENMFITTVDLNYLIQGKNLRNPPGPIDTDNKG